jgi:hypothetical protein
LKNKKVSSLSILASSVSSDLSIFGFKAKGKMTNTGKLLNMSAHYTGLDLLFSTKAAHKSSYFD